MDLQPLEELAGERSGRTIDGLLALLDAKPPKRLKAFCRFEKQRWVRWFAVCGEERVEIRPNARGGLVPADWLPFSGVSFVHIKGIKAPAIWRSLRDGQAQPTALEAVMGQNVTAHLMVPKRASATLGRLTRLEADGGVPIGLADIYLDPRALQDLEVLASPDNETEPVPRTWRHTLRMLHADIAGLVALRRESHPGESWSALALAVKRNSGDTRAKETIAAELSEIAKAVMPLSTTPKARKS